VSANAIPTPIRAHLPELDREDHEEIAYYVDALDALTVDGELFRGVALRYALDAVIGLSRDAWRLLEGMIEGGKDIPPAPHGLFFFDLRGHFAGLHALATLADGTRPLGENERLHDNEIEAYAEGLVELARSTVSLYRRQRNEWPDPEAAA